MDFSQIYRQYFPFWNAIRPNDQVFLCQHSSLVRFETEQAVHTNSGCSGLFIVKTGRLRLYMLSEEGKEITLYRLSPGEVCMLSASCVLQSISFDVFLDAELPSECYRIDGSAFHDLSQRVPQVRIYALEIAVQRFSDVMWIMQQIVFMSMDRRLAIFLLDEANATGSETVTMTHEQIARHLGTAREVVTRMLKHFAQEGWVQVERKGIRLLDKRRLREIAR